tara:strand:- start:711 stop:848 length:138 start_codon:yes stop_codon:yes gene_type:complete
MNKSVRISNLVYEMLVVIAKQNRPSLQPEKMLEAIIEDQYRTLKR